MSQDQIPEETFPSDEEFDDEEVDSESSSDVDAKLLEDEVFDDEFFKCYAALKKKDAKIYDEKVKFFNEDQDQCSHETEEGGDKMQGTSLLGLNKKSTAPKMTLLDYQLNAKDDYPTTSNHDPCQVQPKSYYEQELEDIKRSFAKVSENIDSDSDDELLVVKGSKEGSKSKVAINSLLDKMEEDENDQIKLMNEVWSDSKKLTKDEKYLRDYILNKRYLPTKSDSDEEEHGKSRNNFFSENIDELSDVEDDEKTDGNESRALHLHSEDKNFDKIVRIPRNSTKTIRDMVEKQQKKEKRNKELDKVKKKKKALKDADCEDMVGDLPTKFHYRETEPNDYGLSAEELLMATDEELEKWISLRETIAYKSSEQEMAQKAEFDKRRNDHELKRKIFKSIYDVDQPESMSDKDVAGTRAGKRKRSVEGETSKTVSSAKGEEKQSEGSKEAVDDQKRKKKKKHKRGLNHKKFVKSGVAPDRLLAYGLSKSKLKKSKLL